MFCKPRKWRAMCADGRIRTATQTGEPALWFAAPARVHAYGKTVTGFVSAYSDVPTDDNGNLWEDAPTDPKTGERTAWTFDAALYLTNGNTIPGSDRLAKHRSA